PVENIAVVRLPERGPSGDRARNLAIDAARATHDTAIVSFAIAVEVHPTGPVGISPIAEQRGEGRAEAATSRKRAGDIRPVAGRPTVVGFAIAIHVHPLPPTVLVPPVDNG